MKYYGRAETVAEQIVEAFKIGNIPKALARYLLDAKTVCLAERGHGNQLCVSYVHPGRAWHQAMECRWRTVKRGSKCN